MAKAWKVVPGEGDVAYYLWLEERCDPISQGAGKQKTELAAFHVIRAL